MCGILGSVNQPIETDLLDLLRHRGPDGSGCNEFRNGVGRTLTLAHRRLAIVDLSPAGHQPMMDAAGRFAITFNGEIYNHSELRSQLSNSVYRGHSDTETILNCLIERGIDAVRDFNGIFAFAFYDEDRQKLYLVRDPFGVKPIYYALHNEKLVFASELRPIQKLLGDSVDREHLAELLCLRYSPSPDTLFTSIRKVRPGHIVEINLGGSQLTLQEYPYLRPPTERFQLSYSEAVEEYGRLFEAAVKRQLMSDVEVGILLSGGVDSAMVAALAQKHSSYRMKAFTVGFIGQNDCDEIADAAATAQTLSLEHQTTRIGFDDFLDMMRNCVSIVEEPLATTSFIPMYSLSALAAQKVKVVLTGQGADEPLGGYGRYQGELWHEKIPASLAKIIKPMIVKSGLRNDQILRGLNALSQKDDISRFVSSYSVFSSAEIQRLIGCVPVTATQHVGYYYGLLQCESLRQSVQRMMAVDLRMNLADDLLLYTDKITMHHSLECRVPILDLELVKYIESLPANYRVRFRQGKVIHKKFAEKLLPQSIINRPKKGFQSPTNIWFKSDIVRDMLLDSSSRFADFFARDEVENILNQHVNGYNRERHIFLLLSLYFWLDDFTK